MKGDKISIGFGLLGYGRSYHMGRRHAADMMKTGRIRLAAVCDIDPASLEIAQEEWPRIATFDSYPDMLRDPGVDAVTIILPHHLHFPMALKGIEAGKHVVIEKPMCFTAAEARELISAAEEHHVMLSVYHNRRKDGFFKTILLLVRDGRIGDVFEVHQDVVNYGYKKRTDWRMEKSKSGGLLYDWGSHCIDWNLHLIPRRIVGVSGYLQKIKWPGSNEDHVRTVLRFDNGAVANIAVSDLYAARKPDWVILGTDGAINFSMEGINQTGSVPVSVSTIENESSVRDDISPEASTKEDYYKNIADHLLEGRTLEYPPDESARIIAIIEATERSAEKGREIPFEDEWWRPDIYRY